MPKVSQQYRDARRDHILSAARRCFLRNGFHATSMQDLFAEAGMSSGAVYRYFASKDDMIIAIAEENLRGVVAMILDVAGRQPAGSVGVVMAEVMRSLQAKDAHEGTGGLALLTWSEALRNPELAGRFADLVAQIRTELAQVVRKYQNSGNLLQHVPAESLAAMFLSMLAGYVVQLALLGPGAVDPIPGAVEALWP
jgi:AcrR family transcriptional regulator